MEPQEVEDFEELAEQEYFCFSVDNRLLNRLWECAPIPIAEGTERRSTSVRKGWSEGLRLTHSRKTESEQTDERID